jgi:hypothetical protein
VYLALAFLNAVIGVIALVAPRRGLLAFSLLVLAVPSSTAFAAMTYQYGLHVSDYFFLVLLATYPIRASRTPQPRAAIRIFVILGAVFAAATVGLLVAGRPIDKYVLRDLRPFLVVSEALMFWLLARRVTLTGREILWLGIAAGASPFIGFGLISSGLYAVTDVFYETNSFRYLAIGSYASAVLLMWLSATGWPASRLLTIAAAAAAMAALVLSGSRTLIGATVLGCVVAGPLRAARLVTVGLIGAVVLGAFAYVSVALGVERVSSGTTAEGLGTQLAVRFGPALTHLRTMALWQYVLGSGLGTTFEIPWFEYRDLDAYGNSIDSTYLTLAVKFGLVGLLYLWAFVQVFGVGRISPGMTRALILFLGVVFWTSALPYQTYAFGVPLFCALASRVAIRDGAAPRAQRARRTRNLRPLALAP